MTKIVATNLAQTGASIQFTDGIPAMSPTDGNRKLLEILNQTSIDMKLGAVKEGDPGVRGAGDISYVAQYLDCLDGLGASGTGAHAPGETLNLKQYPNLIKRNTVFLYRLLK
jgi:glutamate carboxypeptidase